MRTFNLDVGSRLAALVGAAALAAACGGDPGSTRNNGPRGGTGGVAGTAMQSAGSSGVGNPLGGGVGGVSGSVSPPPLIDHMATPFIQDDTGLAGLPADVVQKLKDGGGSCDVTIIYPYAGTMFPGGLDAPVVMWNSKADASYVKLTYDLSDKVEYQFAAGPTDPGELQIPREAWNEITRRTPSTSLKVKLSTLSGDTVSTCETEWRVAPGNMTGALYYNTYSAPGATNFDQGAVMRLTLGQPAAEIYLQYQGAAMSGTGPCISCHSVSANGSTIVASMHDYSAKTYDVSSYPLTPSTQPAETAKLENAVLGALTPDGKRILTMGNPDCTAGSETFPRSANNFPLVEGPDHAKILDTATGQEIPSTGLSADLYMWMPQFSPDGKKIAFNHAKPDGSGGTDRRELAVMDYDYATNSFSNLRVIVSHLGPEPSLAYNPAPAGAGTVPEGLNGCTDEGGGTTSPDPMWGGGGYGPGGYGYGGDVGALDPGTCTGPCYPAYPFFTPDGKGVVFAMMSEPDFTNAFPGRDAPAKSELWYADLETGEVVALDNINKALSEMDRMADYFPTVLPIQVGGYYWVFWTSRRAYGHRVVGIGGDIFGIPIPSGASSQFDAIKKRIWVAAIKPRSVPSGEVQAVPGPLTDPSLPGFYLTGQSDSGNVRAFATLNPCVPAGTTCASGLDCCTGYCTIEDGATQGTCTDEVPMCSGTNEKCETSEDCCPPGPDQPKNICLGGFCGFVVLE